jgi:hypothetical protein
MVDVDAASGVARKCDGDKWRSVNEDDSVGVMDPDDPSSDYRVLLLQKSGISHHLHAQPQTPPIHLIFAFNNRA